MDNREQYLQAENFHKSSLKCRNSEGTDWQMMKFNSKNNLTHASMAAKMYSCAFIKIISSL